MCVCRGGGEPRMVLRLCQIVKYSPNSFHSIQQPFVTCKSNL
ncbi:hypothetical protein Hdeb2414_s0013g00414601 [Helianthus debilis subsp. tardiflorus]